MYQIIAKEEYFKNKEKYLDQIKEMYEGDDKKLADIKKIASHLDFIFSAPYDNNAFLVFQILNNKLISMVNFFEYNTLNYEWCLFSLFTKKEFRKKGYGEKLLRFAINNLRNYDCSKLVSGIEEDNIGSIKLHEKVGFKYANCNWNDIDSGFPDNHLAYVYYLD